MNQAAFQCEGLRGSKLFYFRFIHSTDREYMVAAIKSGTASC